MQAQCLTNSAGVPLAPNTCVVTCPPAGTPAGAVLTANGSGGFTWGTSGGTGSAPTASASSFPSLFGNEATLFNTGGLTTTNATGASVNVAAFAASFNNGVVSVSGNIPGPPGTITNYCVTISGPGGSIVVCGDVTAANTGGV